MGACWRRANARGEADDGGSDGVVVSCVAQGMRSGVCTEVRHKTRSLACA